jgi:hypothetical protein
MIYHPKPQPALERPNTAIKTPLKWLASCIFLISAIFILNPSFSFASSILDEDFEIYPVGYDMDLEPAYASTTWGVTSYSTSKLLVTASTSISEDQSIERAYLNYSYPNPAYTLIQIYPTSSTESIVQGVYFKSINGYEEECGYNTLNPLRIGNESYDAFAYFQYEVYDTENCKARIFYRNPAGQEASSTFFFDYPVSLDDWHYLQIESTSTDQIRFTIDGTSTDWITTISFSGHPFNRLSAYAWLRGDFYWDFYTEAPTSYPCSDYTSEGECEADPNCVWWFSQYLFDMNLWPYESCEEKEEVEDFCAGDYFSCKYCNTTTTCAVEGCYWWDDEECHYTSDDCGEGLALQFCLNQGECEGAGGYWYLDFCWLNEGTALLSWDSYYNEFGDYATPTAWIDSVASSTEGIFFTISGFINTFRSSFKIENAYEKGNIFGGAIPVAFGYMAIINQFCGDFPISQLFLFTLGFMLAVGVFRIIRTLVPMFKIL